MSCSARGAIAVLVCLGLIDRLDLQDATAVLAGSAVLALVLVGSAAPVWWWELVGWVERLVGLAQDESRSAASWEPAVSWVLAVSLERVEWLESQAWPVEWLLEGDIPVSWLGDDIRVD